MKATIRFQNLELSFDDSAVVNPDDYIPNGEYNPHSVRPWLLHDHGFPVALVFASNLQDALDIAVDNDKLDAYLIDLETESACEDYLTDNFADSAPGFDESCPEYTDATGKPYWWKVEPAFLGNASEPFDIDALGYLELDSPTFSFAALWEAKRAESGEAWGVRSAHFA